MNKTLVIAWRDYLAAVRTKSFVVSLVLMPVLMGGGLLVGRLSRDLGDVRERTVAVIDRTVRFEDGVPAGTVDGPGVRPLYQVLIDAAQERNTRLREEAGGGRLRDPPFLVELATPRDDSPQALAEERLRLSQRVRNGELFAFVEIGPNVTRSPPEAVADRMTALVGGQDVQADALDDFGLRYSSENLTYLALQQWLTATLAPEIYQRRITSLGSLDPAAAQQILTLMTPPQLLPRALAVRDATGDIVYDRDPNPLVAFMVPLFMVFLMFTVVMTAASPLTTNIVEEKQLRIAEVLLGAVRPFELMLGKLLGGVGISLTLAAIYLGGGLVLAREFDALDAVSGSTVAWFVVFAALGTLMYGALFVAAGAAVTNLKEAQNLLTPIVLLVVSPMFVLINVVQNPDGPLARAVTWFPLTTPMGAVLRLAVPPGLATGDRFAAAGLTVATTLVLVWIAGRIFRFGMLNHDKAAAMGDLVRWAFRGK